MIQERRHFERVGLDSHLLVLLDESKYGLLSDLSPDGLAADVLAARSLGETIPFSFYLPAKSNCIQGRAEIVWTNELEHRIGLHFLELADPSREQLVEWISARAGARRPVDAVKEPVPPAADTEETYALINPIVQEGSDDKESRPLSFLFPGTFSEEYEPQNPELISAGELHYDRKSRPTIAIALALVLLSSVFGYLVYHWRETRMNAQVQEAAAVAKAPELPSADATAPAKPPELPLADATAPAKPPESPSKDAKAPVKRSPAASPVSPPVPRLDLPGFVLQVGAMRNEANADAMAHDLQKKNFPAFVFRRGSDRFYRVAVGPYTDKESSVRVAKELEQRGLKTLPRRWAPE
jgi:cell division septation protein DedD